MTEITGYCARGAALFGDNGGPGTHYELRAGRATSGEPATRKTWVSGGFTNGFETAPLDAAFTANAGGGSGGVSWTVAGGATVPVTFGGVTYGTVTKVTLRVAALAAGLRAELTSVVFTCYRAGSVVEVVEFDDCVADTFGASDPAEDEGILDLEPESSGVTKVEVTAQLRFAGEAGVVPGHADLRAEMFLFAADCTTV